MKTNKSNNYYNQAVSLYLKRELDKLKKLLKSKKLTEVENKLINARMLNLENKFEESLELLSSIETESDYLMAQKYLVSAVVYGRQSMFQHSAVANQQALYYYQKIDEKKGIFQSAFNLCVDYSRLSLDILFEHYWNIANNSKTNFAEFASLTRVKVSYYSKEKNYEMGLAALEKLKRNPKYSAMDNNETFENLQADILFRMKRYRDASHIYKKLLKNKKSLIKPRVIYESAVTDALINKRSLSSVHLMIENKSEYYFLWKILLAFQEGSPDNAYFFWGELRKINPDKYQNNFSFKEKGDADNHFSQFYDMLKLKNRSSNFLRIEEKGNIYKLLKVLEESEVPLRKEIIIERIWKVAYSPSFDARFYKLIERLKKQYRVGIIMEKSTYRLN